MSYEGNVKYTVKILKRMAICLLAVLLLLCVACNPTSQDQDEKPQEPASEYDNEYFKYRDGLGNTYMKLTGEKTLNVAYMGSFVSYGNGATKAEVAYPALVTGWLKEQFPNAEIAEHNASVPHASSAFGAYRVKEMLNSFTPDLVFLEYSLSDYYVADRYSLADTSRYFESIIRQLRSANPYCDIVILHATDGTLVKENVLYHDQASLQNDLGAVYRIPYINVGYQMCQENSMKEGLSSAAWETYFSDSITPNDKGHAAYAAVIQKYLNVALKEAPAKTPITALAEKALPSSQNSNLLLNGTFVKATDLQVISQTGWQMNTTDRGMGEYGQPIGYWYTEDRTNALIFKVTGEEISLFCTAARSITYKIDDQAEVTVAKNNHPALLALSLSAGEHTVTISCNDVWTKGKFEVVGVFVG